jgi:uncharacterized protein
MLYESLPSLIDVRKLATKGAEIRASIGLSELPGFAGNLAKQEGEVEVELNFGIDEQGLKVIEGQLKASVYVTCQRCLGAIPMVFESDFRQVMVWTDEQASKLPRDVEPLIVGDELISLAEVVEEELILSVPFVSYHQPDECSVKPSDLSFGDEVTAQAQEASAEEQKENPFAALGALKTKPPKGH